MLPRSSRWASCGDLCTGPGPAKAAVAWVAERQLALVTTHQLHIDGVGRGALRRRLENEVLHRMYRGVYLVGHPIPLPGARELGAVLACGERAFISHRSAAALWGLANAPLDFVEITVVARGCRSRDGVHVHGVERLAATDRRHKAGIPVTSPARTVVDYAATANATELEYAIAEAFAHNLTDERQILAATERVPNHAGVVRVRAILSAARWRQPDEIRWRAGDVAPAPRGGLAGAAHERRDRRLHRGLRVAGRAADRRARRLPVPRPSGRVRARPSPRHRPQERRL